MKEIKKIFENVNQCNGSGSGYRRAKMTQKNRRKLINFIFKVLDVLFEG
jgi:hypothetical protein